MRLAYVCTSEVPSVKASSITAVKTCDGFAGYGVPVTLISVAPYRDKVSLKKIREFYGVKNRFDIFRMRLFRNGKVAGYMNAFRVIMLLTIKQIDVVYARCNALARLWVHLYPRRVFVEVHKPPESHWAVSKLSKSSKCKGVICISEPLVPIWRHYINERVPFRVEPLGADVVSEVSSIAVGEGKFRLGYFGKLGVDRGIEMLFAVAENCPWCEVLVVGGTELEVETWRLEVRNRRLTNVRILPHVPRVEALHLMKNCHVLVAPYQPSVETFEVMCPLKLLDYMSVGRPIICSKAPVIEQLVRHLEEVVLCTPGDVNEWCRWVAWMRDNYEIANEMALRGRLAVHYRYSWTARSRRICDWMCSLVNPKGV